MIRELRKWTRQERGYDEAGQVGERKEKDPALRRLRASAAGAVLITALLVLPSAPAASAAGLFGDGGLLDGIASGAADLGAGLPGGLDLGSLGNGTLGEAADALKSGLENGLEGTGIAQGIDDLREGIGNAAESLGLPAAGTQGAVNAGADSGNTSGSGLNLPDLDVDKVVSGVEERRLAMEERLKAAAEEAGLTETIESAAENIRSRVDAQGDSGSTNSSAADSQFLTDVKERFDSLRNLVSEAAGNAGMAPEELQKLTDAINEVEQTIRQGADGIRTAVEEERLQKLVEDIKEAFSKLGIRDKSFLERLTEWARRMKEIRDSRNARNSSSSTDWAALLAAQGAGNGTANTDPNYATAIPNEKPKSEELTEEIQEEIGEEAVPLAAYPELVPWKTDRIPWYRSVGAIAAGIAALGAACVLSGMALGRRIKTRA